MAVPSGVFSHSASRESMEFGSQTDQIERMSSSSVITSFSILVKVSRRTLSSMLSYSCIVCASVSTIFALLSISPFIFFDRSFDFCQRSVLAIFFDMFCTSRPTYPSDTR